MKQSPKNVSQISNEQNSDNNEFEKIENSLREFISRIITYYDKFSISNKVLEKYEEEISKSDTLLEVFEVIKDMFEDLMINI